MKALSALKKFMGYRGELKEDCELESLETDSRRVNEKSVFVALKGTRVNGLDFVAQAVRQGAKAIICMSDNRLSASDSSQLGVPVMILPKRKTLAKLGAWFYDNPSHKLSLIGVTGTNGKSTITQLVAQWLTLMGKKCAVLGTLGYGFLPDLNKSANTTLDALTLQKTLAELVRQGALYASLEVSSIGVVEGRVDECRFVAGAFTNLTRDHLDYHGNMENYRQAKDLFLQMVPQECLAINIDNATGSSFAQEYPFCIPYTRQEMYKDDRFGKFGYVWIKKVVFLKDGLQLEIDTGREHGSCRIGLIGSFNVENFACALAIMLSLRFSLRDLLEQAPKLRPVKGRMECFIAEGKPHVVVDYAHTPDGIEQALRAAREHHSDGRIWCVAGCGGNRDRGKRPLMAIKASVFADQAVFTSDNPRGEDPKAILDDMATGVEQASNTTFIVDRKEAINYAFSHASADDVVVICGKGHEDYQIFKDRTIHFSDREIASELTGVDCD